MAIPREDEHPLHEVEDIGARLVDSDDDCHPCRSQACQDVHHPCSIAAVEPCTTAIVSVRETQSLAGRCETCPEKASVIEIPPSVNKKGTILDSMKEA